MIQTVIDDIEQDLKQRTPKTTLIVVGNQEVQKRLIEVIGLRLFGYEIMDNGPPTGGCSILFQNGDRVTVMAWDSHNIRGRHADRVLLLNCQLSSADLQEFAFPVCRGVGPVLYGCTIT